MNHARMRGLQSGNVVRAQLSVQQRDFTESVARANHRQNCSLLIGSQGERLQQTADQPEKSRRPGMLAQHHFALPQVKRRTTQQQLGLPRGAQTAEPSVDGRRRVGQAGTKHGHRDAGSDYP